MARVHWRFVVRDAYGYVIQNASVNVYQPDTTTNFTGNAYTSATGATTVSNPMTTNDQGEVEAWFDTTQNIDVQVDDTSDTAYRAVDGSSEVLSFTTFTEKDIVSGIANPSALGKTSKQTHNTAAEVELSHLAVVANTLVAGSMFRVSCYGYQTNGGTSCTYTFRVRWGPEGSGTVVGQALALVGTTTTHTDNPVQLEFLMTVQSIGATGTATGSWFGSECITTATANTPKLVLDVQNAAATIDTTATTDLTLSLELSTVTGSPNFELDNVAIQQVA